MNEVERHTGTCLCGSHYEAEPFPHCPICTPKATLIQVRGALDRAEAQTVEAIARWLETRTDPLPHAEFVAVSVRARAWKLVRAPR